jgi:serine/threonine protein kinase
MPLSPGDKLGPYEIVAPIGAGGMGEVYRARDPRLDRDVAIKVSAENFSAGFEREARAIAALNHPHICQIHDIGPDYLVLEYVEGRPIAGPMRVEEAVKLAIQMAGALEEAHSRGILHRDLKPANILVSSSGFSKLIDFGLAKVMRNPDLDKTESLDRMILGTVSYMAPEQAEGRPLDERSDVFSFGAVFYEMLAGRKPFHGNSTASVLKALLRDDPAPIQAPAEVQRILAKCMAKRPRDRFQSMTELKASLEEVSIQPSDRHPASAGPIGAGVARTNVGREAQKGQLRRGYSRVKAGRGVILAVTGEAGIGKTSTLEDFLAELVSEGEQPIVARGRCSQRLAGE